MFFWFAEFICVLFFFFQAEDGIRDVAVTGVQTCALPIWGLAGPRAGRIRRGGTCHQHRDRPDRRATTAAEDALAVGVLVASAQPPPRRVVAVAGGQPGRTQCCRALRRALRLTRPRRDGARRGVPAAPAPRRRPVATAVPVRRL